MMRIRTYVAAFTLFVFVMLLSASAFAGALAWLPQGDEGCCCAKDEATEAANVAAPECECPSCACTLEEPTTPQPWSPVVPHAEAELPVADAPAAVAVQEPKGAAADRNGPGVRPRGPPDGSRPPLYIFFDSLLI